MLFFQHVYRGAIRLKNRLITGFPPKKIVLSLFIISMATGVLLEVALRIYLGNNYICRLLEFDPDGLVRVQLASDKSVRHTGVLERIHPVIHKSNSFGYRGEPRPPKTPHSAYRIIVIGDSYTYCAGVPEGEDYPSWLERRLREKTGADIEVLNFGVPSLNLREVYDHFVYRTADYTPDMVILQTAGGDFAPSLCDVVGGMGGLVRKLFRLSYIFRGLVVLFMTQSADLDISCDQGLVLVDQFANDVRCQIRERKIPVRVVSFNEPVICSTEDDESFLDPVFEKLGIPYMPFPAELRPYLNMDVGHLDREGTKRYGYRLAEWTAGAVMRDIARKAAASQ